MTTTHHREYLPDRTAMESIRLMLSPMKGSVHDPSARESFDHLMANTPAAPGIAYKAASIGGVPGWWCLPGDATPHSAILYFHGGGYVVGSAQAYRHFAGLRCPGERMRLRAGLCSCARTPFSSRDR
jgi:epsilon-lactone hydrolase